MTDAYKCNRCGEFQEGSPAGTIDTTLVSGPVDLCSECARIFKSEYTND